MSAGAASEPPLSSMILDKLYHLMSSSSLSDTVSDGIPNGVIGSSQVMENSTNDGITDRGILDSECRTFPPILDRLVEEDSFENSTGSHSPVSLIGSPIEKKTVRFNDEVKRQIYRSNSSILGQRKKNQRKCQNRRKSRDRLNSIDSISSFDESEDGSSGSSTNGIHSSITGNTEQRRQRFNSGASVSSLDDEEFDKYSSLY